MIDTDKIADKADNAFEYVLGTLRDDERLAFEKMLLQDCALQEAVRYWEQQLSPLNSIAEEVPPDPKVWQGIQQQIHGASITPTSSGQLSRREWWQWVNGWRLATIASLLLVGLLSFQIFQPSSTMNADYVAVLTDPSGSARLTALTATDGETLWLRWEEFDIPDDQSVQLWAVSRRDGQSRSLAVFSREDSLTDGPVSSGDEGFLPPQLTLNEAGLRLIRDSSHLIITQEELGGSAIDEPSEDVIAKGVCVRLQGESAS